MNTSPRTIDITPTWRGVLPILLAAYTDGNATGRQTALAELYRMADIADRAVTSSKEER